MVSPHLACISTHSHISSLGSRPSAMPNSTYAFSSWLPKGLSCCIIADRLSWPSLIGLISKGLIPRLLGRPPFHNGRCFVIGHCNFSWCSQCYNWIYLFKTKTGLANLSCALSYWLTSYEPARDDWTVCAKTRRYYSRLISQVAIQKVSQDTNLLRSTRASLLSLICLKTIWLLQ